MEAKEFVRNFEEEVKHELISYLQKEDKVDMHVPQCIDVEECWHEIVRSYIPDGIKEFNQYPVVSLGWMMFIGMAMAFFWDEDWDKYRKNGKFYEFIRDKCGFDNLDDAVIYEVLKYEGEAADKEVTMVSDCAARVYNLITHRGIELGTEIAFGCYVAALHQLYLAGMAMELKNLGYKMSRLE